MGRSHKIQLVRFQARFIVIRLGQRSLGHAAARAAKSQVIQ